MASSKLIPLAISPEKRKDLYVGFEGGFWKVGPNLKQRRFLAVGEAVARAHMGDEGDIENLGMHCPSSLGGSLTAWS